MMDSLLDRITIDPDLCNGKPTLRGKRITAQTILDYLNAGEARDEILHQYPSLEDQDIEACSAFATALAKPPAADEIGNSESRSSRDESLR